MNPTERIPTEPMKPSPTDGRDELNLAEFPLCALAHRVAPGTNTIRFADQVWDETRRETVSRCLTVTASEAYGLPTALDDDVLLGLIQLTRQHQFADRKVPFTRYQLIHLLGWRDETRSYSRLAGSLRRWTGVTLDYANAWWNKARQCWMDETFHVLDNVWLCHRTGRAEQSLFVWNEVLFRSFREGNLKSLDFEFYQGLESMVAKRLYRFLDKRFYHRPRWEFDLHELAWEHVGLSRVYDTANLKRKLEPALRELEDRGYLLPSPEGERFRKVRAGEWSITLQRRGEAVALPAPGPAEPVSTSPLLAALIQRGLTPAVAGRTVASHPAAHIQAQVEVFDWLVARRDPRISRNPPGFLLSSIKQGYAPPKDFVSPTMLRERERQATERQRQAADRQARRTAREQLQATARQQAITGFWESLAIEARQQLETDVLAQASPFQRALIEKGGSVGTAARQALLEGYALRQLAARSPG